MLSSECITTFLPGIYLYYLFTACPVFSFSSSILIVLRLLLLQGCQPSPEPVLPLDPDTEVAVWWADMTLATARSSAGHTPTYTSRSLAYMGLIMYETVVHGNG